MCVCVCVCVCVRDVCVVCVVCVVHADGKPETYWYIHASRGEHRAPSMVPVAGRVSPDESGLDLGWRTIINAHRLRTGRKKTPNVQNKILTNRKSKQLPARIYIIYEKLVLVLGSSSCVKCTPT